MNYCASINYHDIGLKDLNSRVAAFNTPNMSTTVYESLDVDELTDDGELKYFIRNLNTSVSKDSAPSDHKASCDYQ